MVTSQLSQVPSILGLAQVLANVGLRVDFENYLSKEEPTIDSSLLTSYYLHKIALSHLIKLL
jgi:hypothetical protein